MSEEIHPEALENRNETTKADNLTDSLPETPNTANEIVLPQKRLAKIKEDFFTAIVLDSACGSSRNSSLSSTKNDYIIAHLEEKKFEQPLKILINESSLKIEEEIASTSTSFGSVSAPIYSTATNLNTSPIDSVNPVSCLRTNIKKIQNSGISFASPLKSPTITNSISTLTDRFVQQHHGGAKGRHRRLKKYASESGFGVSVLKKANEVAIGGSQPNSDDTPSPPVSGTLEPLLGSTLFLKAPTHSDSIEYVEIKTSTGRPPLTKLFKVINVPNGGGTVINKLNKRRQDSDDISGSLGSEASGTMTPQSRRNQRFRMRRPKSTGNMIGQNSLNYYHYQDGHQVHCCQISGKINDLLNANDNNNTINYDPSFTSATIHSLDDSIQQSLNPNEIEERRHSNFYLFENDSNHEFGEVNGGKF